MAPSTVPRWHSRLWPQTPQQLHDHMLLAKGTERHIPHILVHCRHIVFGTRMCNIYLLYNTFIVNIYYIPYSMAMIKLKSLNWQQPVSMWHHLAKQCSTDFKLYQCLFVPFAYIQTYICIYTYMRACVHPSIHPFTLLYHINSLNTSLILLVCGSNLKLFIGSHRFLAR